MKINALIALLLIPAMAFAVRKDDCPAKISVRIGNLSALSVNQIVQSNSAFLEGEEEKVGKIRDALFNVRSYEKNVVLQKGRKGDAYCFYLPEGVTKSYGDNETRIQRKAGRDILRISIDLGIKGVSVNERYNETVWTYVNLEKYSPAGVEITPVRGSKVMGWQDHGSPVAHFGWANDISAK